MKSAFVRLLTLAGFVLVGAASGSCANPFAGQPSPTSDVSIMAVVTAYPAPATVAPPTASLPATAVPTVPPPPATRPTLAPGAESLVGPEWTIAYSGDLNADGRADVVAYKPGGVTPGPTFSRSGYTGYIGSISEAVIVQADAAGKPQTLVRLSRSGVMFGQRVAVSFPPSNDARNNPVAIMLLIETTQPPVVAALPINSSGEPYTQAAGVRWNRSRAAYELITGGK
jgi:hypothetical protein